MFLQTASPRYVKANPNDNVAIIVNDGGLPKGSLFDCGLILREHIPEAHKVALYDLDAGAEVIRYGAVIGHARQHLSRGCWVHEGNIDLPEAPSLENLPVSTNLVHLERMDKDYTFEGFVNPDGSVGTKNILGISTTVQCVAATVRFAVDRIKRELLEKFPNVDDVIALLHPYGCGVAIDAPGSEIPIRTLRNLALNPNLGASPLVVSLGCEKLQPARLLHSETLPILYDEPSVIRLQDENYLCFGDMVDAIMRAAELRLTRLDMRRRTTCNLSGLVVGLQCGGSDAFSGVTANPAVGYAADLLVRSGATVMFSEVTEVRDAIHLLTARAANPEVAAALVREMAWYDRYLDRGSVDRSANPTPGNKSGGLANILEKALGSVAKSGSAPISGVCGPGERAKTAGLVFAATPASDFICGTLQLASAMNVHVFTTGRGTPYGLAMAPVIKVSSRTSLAHRWKDLIDIDAGTIATGHETVEDVGFRIFQLILDVASGRKKTWSDYWHLHNDIALFNPAPVT